MNRNGIQHGLKSSGQKVLNETLPLFGTFVVADSEVVFNAHQLLAQARYAKKTDEL